MKLTEDEFQFLLVCLAYRDVRQLILPKYYCGWPSKQKFKNLLSHCQTSI